MLQPTMSSLAASDGLRLAYRVDDFTPPWQPNPTPVLLLHPAMGAYRRWYGWIPLLARHFPVISLDLRGHGASEVPGEDRPLTLPRLQRDALELLDHLGVARAHVVGNSAGGYIGQRLAIETPDRVASLALVAATPGLKHSKAGGWISEIAGKGIEAFIRETIDDRFPADADPGLKDWFARQTGSNDPAFIARFVTHMTTHDWTPELPRIGCPTLILAPGAEPIGHHGQYEAMQAAIPDARLVTLQGMPHNIGDAAPERCAQEVLAFLQSLSH